MSNSENNKRIAKNTIFLYIRMLLVLGVSLYTTRIVLKALGVVDYGIYNVVAGFVSMFTFLSGSMSNAIQRFYNFQLGKNGEESLSKVYNTALQLQFIIALVLLVVLETLGLWYMYTQMVIPDERFKSAMWVFQFSIVSMIINIMQVPHSAAIMAYERMNYFAYVSIVDVILKLLIAYLLINSNGDKLFVYGGLHASVSFITFLMYFLYCKCNLKHIVIKMIIEKNLLRSMFSFSSWNLLETFAYMIKGQGLNMLLNVFFGPIVNAARGISAMIMSAIQGFQVNIVVAFRPQLITAYSKGDMRRVRQLFYSLSKISFILLSVLSIPLIIELDYILKMWLGHTIPSYTKSFTILVLINLIISSLNTPVSQVVHATGNVKKYDVATSLVICAILPISWICLKRGCSPVSVYIVSLIMTIINQIICNIYLKKVFIYSIKEYIYKVILPCSYFILLSPILPYQLTQYHGSSFTRFLLVCIVSIIVSCLIAYYIVLNDSEKSLIKNTIKRK